MTILTESLSDKEAESLRQTTFLDHNDEEEQRVQRIRKHVLEISNPSKPRRQCSIHRARIVTESYRETEGEPTIMRRAKAFYKILKEIPIFVMDDQLFVGEGSAYWRGGEFYPEPGHFSGESVKEELDNFPTREAEPFHITEEDKSEYLNEISPYWKNKSAWERVLKALPEETRRVLEASNVFTYGEDRPHYNPNQRMILEKGLNSIKKEIEEERNGINLARCTSLEEIERAQYLDAQAICCDAVIAYTKRHADECRRVAVQENDPRRKAELEKMSEICDWVPANPARTFWEALQCAVFCYFTSQLEFYPTSYSYGRFDRLYYPYLKRDLDEGRIVRKEAQELLECFYLNAHVTFLYDSLQAGYLTGASTLGPQITIGGIDEHGFDVTNELSYMVLEAQAHLRVWGSWIAVRIHRETPDSFFLKALEIVRMGGGIPQLLNDEIGVSQQLASGCELEDARNYVPHGCVEFAPDGNFARSSWPHSYTGHFNLLQCVNYALHDGINPLTKEQLGPRTGDAANFKTFDELMGAVEKQTKYFTSQVATIANIYERVHADNYPMPFTTLFMGVIGKDLWKGGAYYNWVGSYIGGQANAGDSLAAIKKLVFDEKKITMAELIKALDANWEGYEELRQMCIGVPKYGNNDDYVDQITRQVVYQYYDAWQENCCPRGGRRNRAGVSIVTSYLLLGGMAAASADGRRDREPIADSVAPTSGRDTHGPTQAMRSVAKLDHVRMPNAMTYNMKFHPGLVGNETGLRKWMDMIKTYFVLGGMQVQINVVSKETLLDAQKQPENYQDLLIRVAGYSTRFIDLERKTQDTIIARTEFDS